MRLDDVLRCEERELILCSLAAKARRSGLHGKKVSGQISPEGKKTAHLEQLFAPDTANFSKKRRRERLGDVSEVASTPFAKAPVFLEAISVALARGGKVRTEQPVRPPQTRPFAFAIRNCNDRRSMVFGRAAKAYVLGADGASESTSMSVWMRKMGPTRGAPTSPAVKRELEKRNVSSCRYEQDQHAAVRAAKRTHVEVELKFARVR